MESIVQELADKLAENILLVLCKKAGNWSHLGSGFDYCSIWKVFSMWISKDEKDEQELFYRLLDEELVLYNDGEFGATNEEILAASE